MKKPYTAVLSNRVSRYDVQVLIKRVLADSEVAVFNHFEGAATHVFTGHPSLEGEEPNEEFLKVIEIPTKNA